MPVFDIHTHAAIAPFCESVRCIDTNPCLAIPGGLYSAGVHPWNLNPDNFQDQVSILKKLMRLDAVVALGECGLDSLRGPSMEFQTSAFVQQARLAEECRKPMILHVVRKFDLIISIRKQLAPSGNWLIHGFRGGVHQMKQLLDLGFFLSFGIGANPESLALVPECRLILETDGRCSISDVQNFAASVRQCSVQKILESSACATAYFLGL